MPSRRRIEVLSASRMLQLQAQAVPRLLVQVLWHRAFLKMGAVMCTRKARRPASRSEPPPIREQPLAARSSEKLSNLPSFEPYVGFS
jgi:hypothetical protein